MPLSKLLDELRRRKKKLLQNLHEGFPSFSLAKEQGHGPNVFFVFFLCNKTFVITRLRSKVYIHLAEGSNLQKMLENKSFAFAFSKGHTDRHRSFFSIIFSCGLHICKDQLC